MTAEADRAAVGGGAPAVGVSRAMGLFVALKWHVLSGSLRRSGQGRLQVVSALVASSLLGALGLLILTLLGRNVGIADDLLVVFLPAAVFGVGLLSAATGVESAVDPRAFAGEPIGRLHLGLGMLSTAVIGPPAVLAALVGFGVIGGWWSPGVGPGAVVVIAVVGWWMSLLLASRTLANLIGAVATTRFRQLAHAGATFAALGALLVTQLLAANPESWNARRWESMAGVARWTPPGQLRARRHGSSRSRRSDRSPAGRTCLAALVVGGGGPEHGSTGAVLAASGRRRAWDKQALHRSRTHSGCGASPERSAAVA
ncbi:MAG: hypothetical protein M5U19_22280 [Microthrixaceae bacterium]|nr:hypothetical protein [Microthrixaceae bacterium]